jgi:hypothetical protein
MEVISYASANSFVQGTCAFVFLLLQSPSPVRHSFYEVFLHGHIVAAALALGALWVHLKGREQKLMLYGVIALWAMERFLRFFRLVTCNVGSGGTQADVEVLPGDALRVTVRMARPWRFRPGQHAYLYIPSVGLWTNHPFSVAWSEEEEDVNSILSTTDGEGLACEPPRYPRANQQQDQHVIHHPSTNRFHRQVVQEGGSICCRQIFHFGICRGPIW